MKPRPTFDEARRVLEANYRRAATRHDQEQTKGRTDMSVKQTRRMALAVAALQRAAGALARHDRSARLIAARERDEQVRA